MKIKHSPLFTLIELLLAIVLLAGIAGAIIGAASTAGAADLSYPTLVPQVGDLDAQISHKNNLFLAPRLWMNITAAGTYTLQTLLTGTTGTTVTTGSYPGLSGAIVTGTQTVTTLEAVIVNVAATGGTCALTDGTVPIANLSTATVGRTVYGVALRMGTLGVVVTGTANLTITYR